jgi:hypothetical protein
VRQESEGLVRYCHIGTGNYNPKTARLYEDLGVLTCDPQVGEDLSRLFNQLSGIAPRSRFRRLLVAPRTVRSGLIEMVDAEIARHAEHGDGHIRLKMNSIVDEALIDALYRASQAGVRVEVWVRGICAHASGGAGPQRQPHGAVHARSLPRALAHLLVRRWGQPAGLHRQRRHDAPQPRPPRRGAPARSPSRAHVAELTFILNTGLADSTSRFDLGPDGTWTRTHLDEAGHPLDDIQELMWEYRNEATPQSSSALAMPRDQRRRHGARGDGVTAMLEVALVHRPKYDDWSWSKGKLERGRDLPGRRRSRETREETGLHVRLGMPLPPTAYRVLDRHGRPRRSSTSTTGPLR